MRFSLLFLLMILTASAFGQSDCKAFFPFKKGVMLEYTSYDKKDKLTTTANHEISALSTADGGVEAEVTSRLSDKKGKEMHTGAYKVRCKDDILYMDMSRMIPAEMQESFGSMEATMEGEDMMLPARLEVGQTLPDANITIKINSGGMANLMNMTMSVTDRKVEGKETITTPAGSFECYKITATTNVKTIIGRTMKSAEWYAPEIGMVRSEYYDKKGEMDGYTVLTKLNK